VGDNGERLEHERHPFGPQRRGRGVDCFGHVKVEVRPVRVPRVADRAEHLAPADRIADSHPQLVPHLKTECPEMEAAHPDVLKAAAAANIVLSAGSLCAHRTKEGAVASYYKVKTAGLTTIRGTRFNYDDRVLTLQPDALIEIVNEPVHESVENHFIAYYKKIAANDACCTNLPFRQVKAGDYGCELPVPDERIISTVACSNSNYP